MNYYPGEGLGIGTAILGNATGQEYPAGASFTLCKLFGYLLLPAGTPAGSATTSLTGAVGEPLKLTTGWKGVEVQAYVNPADSVSGKIVTTDKVKAVSNEAGYFEIYVIQGLTVFVTCPAFGKTVTVNTTGLTSVDLSASF